MLLVRIMKLSELASVLNESQRFGDDVEIAAIAYDSRLVTPGALFVALKGAKSDGHDYIAQAMGRGAVALAVNADRAGWYGSQGVPMISMVDTRKALPKLSATLYGEPSRDLDLIGVTGTNGKTSTAYMIESIMRTWGDRTGLAGTLGGMINGKSFPLERTTPESADLQRLFAEMRDLQVRRVVIEVSSEGILQGRTSECAFDTGVFTNLTQDHLNTHKTMDAYFAEKMRLFTEYPNAFPEKTFNAVVNVDDTYGQQVAQAVEEAGRVVIRYALEDQDAQLRAKIDEISPSGTRFTVTYRQQIGSPLVFSIQLRIPGIFNVYNALAAVGVALLRRIPVAAIQNGLAALAGVSGRFETIDTGNRGFHIVVDYAHTGDGLEKILRSARALNPSRLICVFGCGGDRDNAKRPIMGRISSELADLTIVTSDNPRTENPEAIIDQIVKGIPNGRLNKQVIVQADRHQAIQMAICELAQPGDLIVIAGKGHEAGQILADRTIPFDDRQVAREVLAQCA
jgi:UDP-N-acetylmuramoyl-L-alanyl-D-glutamate--2,6-diaminopimelate ligase